nr:NAD(P)-dependent oxidoreductase [Streptomyces sp. NBRC 109706]
MGFPRESAASDRRTLLTPTTARAMTTAGVLVLAESGIAARIGNTDAELEREGVCFAAPDDVWAAPLVLRYKNPHPSDLSRLTPAQSIGALFHAEGDPAMLAALADSKTTAFSYEFLRDAGRFPLASAGGRIAGVQAVLAGSQALQDPRGRGVLLGGAPGASPARVVVIGCGNVGSAAAQTAAALGAQVTVLAHTRQSADRYRQRAPHGVSVEVNCPAKLRELLVSADLVIGAILISTYGTPAMICEADLERMQDGAVIVDATCGYGTGYLPTAGPVQRPGDPPRLVRGVLHVKQDALPVLVPRTASHAYTASAAPYLVRLARHVLTGQPDPQVASACIARNGRLVHPVLREHAAFYGLEGLG